MRRRARTALLAFAAFLLCSCESLKRAASPVAIFDARIAERAPPVGDASVGVEFVAANLSGRPLKSVAVFAALQERSQDGGQEDDFGGAFCERRFVLDGGLDAGQEETVFVPFEGAAFDCDADGLEIQSLFVESAVYEDGEVYSQ